MDFRVAQRSMIRTKQRMYISTHAPYILQQAHAHTHTHILQKAHAHHIFYRRRDNAKTFLCAHTHRSHQSQIQHAKCVRPTFFNHCCVSSAAAQKQSTCKGQGMDSLHAQRPMIRTKQSMYISTHAPYLERAPNRVPSNWQQKCSKSAAQKVMQLERAPNRVPSNWQQKCSTKCHVARESAQ